MKWCFQLEWFHFWIYCYWNNLVTVSNSFIRWLHSISIKHSQLSTKIVSYEFLVQIGLIIASSIQHTIGLNLVKVFHSFNQFHKLRVPSYIQKCSQSFRKSQTNSERSITGTALSFDETPNTLKLHSWQCCTPSVIRHIWMAFTIYAGENHLFLPSMNT